MSSETAKEIGQETAQKTAEVRFGGRVKDLRSEKDLTQGDLAEMVGTDQGYISALERGKKNPTLGTMVGLAEALEVELVGLFDFRNQVEKLREKNREMANIIVEEEELDYELDARMTITVTRDSIEPEIDYFAVKDD